MPNAEGLTRERPTVDDRTVLLVEDNFLNQMVFDGMPMIAHSHDDLGHQALAGGPPASPGDESLPRRTRSRRRVCSI